MSPLGSGRTWLHGACSRCERGRQEAQQLPVPVQPSGKSRYFGLDQCLTSVPAAAVSKVTQDALINYLNGFTGMQLSEPNDIFLFGIMEDVQ